MQRPIPPNQPPYGLPPQQQMRYSVAPPPPSVVGYQHPQQRGRAGGPPPQPPYMVQQPMHSTPQQAPQPMMMAAPPGMMPTYGGHAMPQQQQQQRAPGMVMPAQGMMQFPGGGIIQPQQQIQVGMVPTSAQHSSLASAAAVGGARKKRRHLDKMLTPEVRQLVPEADAYMSLLAFEQKLDATLTRKKLDIQEALKRPLKVKRRLRIYVSHSFTPGREPEQRDGSDGQIPMWELRVEGKLLDDPPRTASVPVQSKRKFSSFFKSLVIELDKDIYGPDNHLVEWHRTQQTNETDGFQVKRPGDRDVKCTILLLLDHQPMKFKLHPRLAKLLGIAMETRPRIIEALWQYIKTHRLQDAVDRDVINCDHYLEQVFTCKKMRFLEIPQRLQPLLQQPDPLVLNHVIRYEHGGMAAGAGDAAGKNTACYDIDVEMDDPTKLQMSAFIQSHNNAPEIMALDQKIYDLVEQIGDHKIRRDFYTRFADSPQEFVQKWLISQSKELKTISEISPEFEVERRADHYMLPQTQEGVCRYIYGRVLQKRMELEQTLGIKYN